MELDAFEPDAAGAECPDAELSPPVRRRELARDADAAVGRRCPRGDEPRAPTASARPLGQPEPRPGQRATRRGRATNRAALCRLRIGPRRCSCARCTGNGSPRCRPACRADSGRRLLDHATPGVACAVLVSDCLPVLLAAPAGRAVGAAHAGWRGLAAGVLEPRAAVAVARRASRPNCVAWLGPCIGPAPSRLAPTCSWPLVSSPLRRAANARISPDGATRWRADLPRLARDRLAALGVRQVSGGTWSPCRSVKVLLVSA